MTIPIDIFKKVCEEINKKLKKLEHDLGRELTADDLKHFGDTNKGDNQ